MVWSRLYLLSAHDIAKLLDHLEDEHGARQAKAV